MIVLDIKLSGMDVFSNINKDLVALKKKASADITRKVSKVPGSVLKKVSLGSTIKNLPESFVDQPELKNTDKVDKVVISRGRRKYVQSFHGKSVDAVKKEFSSSSNGIALVIPKISKDKAIVFKPRATDLLVKRDRRSPSLYSISLKPEAIKRVTKHFERHIVKVLDQEMQSRLLGRRKVKGIEFEIAGRLGAQAESIQLSSISSIGMDLTAEVRAEATKRMGKGGADSKLNYRSGRFVRSITSVIVTQKDTIAYSLQNRRKYGIHEKEPKGTPTVITPKNGPFLRFRSLKTGRWMAKRQVTVRSRPIIKTAIRAVALSKFKQKFKAVLR